MAMHDITLVSHAGAPAGVADDLALAAAITDAGGTARIAAWSDPSIDWAASPVAVVRSTWDYHLRGSEWSAWLDHVSTQTRLVNAPGLIRWNSVKTYLLELAAKGVSVIPTALYDAHAGLDALCRERGWTDIVVKPAVGASSHGAKRFAGDTIARNGDAHARTLAAHNDVLVQPYQAAIEVERERSLVYIDGTFSHAFSKPGFYAGGAANALEKHDPPEAELALAHATLAALPVQPVFARIDMLPGPKGPMLMEAELIEPLLAFQFGEAGLKRLAKALLAIT
jgi:glutathione synthase/RimK-type ligase-like ATP-grasp enzyme